MKLSKAVSKVIDLARRIREYYDTELPKWHPNYPLIGPDEESVPPPLEEMELRDFLAGLPDEIVYQLVLLMYLGREDFSVNDLPGYYEARKENVGDPDYARSQLMLWQAVLADELSDGLDQLRTHNIEVDRIPLRRAKARKR